MTLPNFLIIGAAKAGTTSLYHYLKQHPQIYMSSNKEPKFFAYENEPVNHSGPQDKESLKDVITDLSDYSALFSSVKEEIAIGEASALYLYSLKAVEKIYYYLPNVKLIAILRNPIDRAYSSFLHLVRDQREPIKDFSLALQQEKDRIENDWEFIWHYKQVGYYYEQIKRYYDKFKPEQIQVYLYEDFSSNPLMVVQDIYKFIGVDASFIPDISTNYNVSRTTNLGYKNKSIHDFIMTPNLGKEILKMLVPKKIRKPFVERIKRQNTIKPVLLAETRQQLVDDYREDILNLQDLIQRDLSNWLM